MVHIVGVVGLGYVGLPLAVEFVHRGSVVGYDADPARVAQCAGGVDPSEQVQPGELLEVKSRFPADKLYRNGLDVWRL